MDQPTMKPMRRILRQWESPPTWLILCISFAWAQSRYVTVWNAGHLGDWLGAALILAGLLLLLVSLVQFAKARTTVMPREEARVLITGGVFYLSRNPVYVADALILAGLCLRWDLGALIWVIFFVIVIDQRFVEGEEAGLRAKFGPQFHDWAEKTRRWI